MPPIGNFIESTREVIWCSPGQALCKIWKLVEINRYCIPVAGLHNAFSLSPSFSPKLQLNRGIRGKKGPSQPWNPLQRLYTGDIQVEVQWCHGEARNAFKFRWRRHSIRNNMCRRLRYGDNDRFGDIFQTLLANRQMSLAAQGKFSIWLTSAVPMNLQPSMMCGESVVVKPTSSQYSFSTGRDDISTSTRYGYIRTLHIPDPRSRLVWYIKMPVERLAYKVWHICFQKMWHERYSSPRV